VQEWGTPHFCFDQPFAIETPPPRRASKVYDISLNLRIKLYDLPSQRLPPSLHIARTAQKTLEQTIVPDWSFNEMRCIAASTKRQNEALAQALVALASHR